ncbi:MAG: ATP synthase F1 subunit delta [Planctomycetota bacterium]|nr:ATP synthase F1 subunit delta [Planctomycetota bacterium]
MPLIESKPDAVSNIYAKSLLQLVEQAGGRAAAEEALGELEDVLELARENVQFGEFLSSRVLASKDRAQSLDRIFAGRIGKLTLQFLQVLNRKGRLSALPSIVASFDAIVQEKYGRVEVDVYTAEPAQSDDLRRLRDRLQGVLKKDVILHPYTDASMIGGVRLKIGDQLVDASVATQLRRVRERLANEGASQMRAKLDQVEG